MPLSRGLQSTYTNRRSAPDLFLPIITQDFSPGTWAGTWGGTRRGTWGGTWAGTRRAPWEALCEPDTWHTHLQDHPGPRSPTYNKKLIIIDRKSTRLNSSHVRTSYTAFCLKKKKLD